MIKLEDVQEVLQQQRVPAETITKVIKELKEVQEEKKADKETGPKQKNQFVVIAFDEQGVIKGPLTAAVLQIEDGLQPSVAIDRLKSAAKLYNSSKKGQRSPVKSLGATLDIPRKFSKNERVMVKTKRVVELVISDNKL